MPEFATGGALPKGHERLIQPSGCTYTAPLPGDDPGILARLNVASMRLDSGQCVDCGEDGATEVWRDADGTGWWIHDGC